MRSVDQIGQGVFYARAAALGASVLAAVGGFLLFLQFGATDGVSLLEVVRSVFILCATFWLAWGASQAIVGLVAGFATVTRPEAAGPITARTVILVPVYNEDPVATFARIAAMDADLAATGQGAHFHFAILSDSTDSTVAQREAVWFQRLVTERDGAGRIFYRRRSVNTGKKAGNIEEFIQRSGAAYDFALILDADSLMEGATILRMVRRMQADPRLGLLQSLPTVIGAVSRFGRAMQFSAGFHSPVFARGLATMQGETGPFWGHNALVRVRAFAESCGLPELSGKPPFGGHILSHDYVEAALLARAGWQVRLDDDLTGSYEEGPGNIVDHAKRDRRWCQGNLQHARLLTAAGLRPWSRFVFVQGILAYLAALFWIGFLLASIATPAFSPEPDYFPQPYWPFPVLPPDETSKAVGLAIGIFGLLILPKFLILLDAILRRRAEGFGGAVRAAESVLAELVLSSITAPIFMMFQTRSVLQVLIGRDGGWPAHDREGAALSLSEAWAASHWIVSAGLIGISATYALSPALVPWLLPVTLPMALAPFLIAWTSRPARTALFVTRSETAPARVIRRRDAILAQWRNMSPAAQPVAPAAAAFSHV